MTNKPCGASHLHTDQQSSNQCSKSAFKPPHKEGSPGYQHTKGCNDKGCNSNGPKGCNKNNPNGCNSPRVGPKSCNNNKKPPKCKKPSSPEYVIPPAYSPALLSIFNNDTDGSEISAKECPPCDIEIGTPSEPLVESEAGQPGCFTKEDKKRVKVAKKEIKAREKKNSKKSKEGDKDKKASKKAKVKIKRGSPKPSFWSRFRRKNKQKNISSPVPPSISISTPVIVKQTVSDEELSDDDLGSVTSLAASIASYCPDTIVHVGSPTQATQSYCQCQCGGSESEAEGTVHEPDCEMFNMDPTTQHDTDCGVNDCTSEGQTIVDHESGCDANDVTEEDDLSVHEECCGVYEVSEETVDQDCGIVEQLPVCGDEDPTLNIGQDCVVNVAQDCEQDYVHDRVYNVSYVNDQTLESESTVQSESSEDEDEEDDSQDELEQQTVQGQEPCCNLFDPTRGITLHDSYCTNYSWPTYYPTTDCQQEFKMERQQEEFGVRAVSPCYFVAASTSYEVLNDSGEVSKGRETERTLLEESVSAESVGGEVAVGQADNNNNDPYDETAEEHGDNAGIYKDWEDDTINVNENVNHEEVDASYKYTVSPDKATKEDNHCGDEAQQYDAECDLPSTGEGVPSPAPSEESLNLEQPIPQHTQHNFTQTAVQQPHYENVPSFNTAAYGYTETLADSDQPTVQPLQYTDYNQPTGSLSAQATLQFTVLPELNPLPVIPDHTNQDQLTSLACYFPTDTIATTIASPSPSQYFPNNCSEIYATQTYLGNDAPKEDVCHLCSNNRYPTPQPVVCSECNHNYSAHEIDIFPQRGILSPQAIYSGGMVGSFPLIGGLSSRSRRNTGESTPSPSSFSSPQLQQRCESVQSLRCESVQSLRCESVQSLRCGTVQSLRCESVQSLRCGSVMSECSEITQYCSYCKARYYKAANKRAPKTRLTVIPVQRHDVS